MMQRIECTKCGEVVELTGTSVTLPFVCEDCEESQVFLEKISPSLQDFASNPTLISALKKQGYVLRPVGEIISDLGGAQSLGEATVTSQTQAESEFSDDHDGATVENTNILIEDLKQRLRNANDLLENSRKQVDAERELKELYFQELSKELSEKQDAEAVAFQRDEVINKLTKANVNLWARIKNLREFNMLMRHQITILSKQRAFWRDAARNNESHWQQAVRDRRALVNRGLFARLFNKESK